MEELNEKNNDEEKKKRNKRKVENTVELKVLRPGEILLTHISNNKTTTYLLDTNDYSTTDILNYYIGRGEGIYRIIDYIVLSYKNNLVKNIDYFITHELKFYKPLGLIKKFPLYRYGFKGNITNQKDALHLLRIALFLFLFEECSGDPSEVIKKFRERKRKTWRTIKEYNFHTLLAYIHKATKKTLENIVNDEELFKTKSHNYKFNEDFMEYKDGIEPHQLRGTLSEYTKCAKKDPLNIILQKGALSEIFNVVYKDGTDDEKKLFNTFLNIHLYPNAWNEARKINNLEWSTYKKLKRRIKNLNFFKDDGSRS
ncbi:hypothetical protein [Atribacter laminatus]|uniref:Uncharacterized protein n=1 Tax=Atribacter laminatus TaxID=2847778 RepID=A0A7T1AKX6_ATRLM|nr:hypothetical protein [Atribacter laminatus]QPM67833.1 hypothetical protein RT761_01046 [Atribacter laminatus]